MSKWHLIANQPLLRNTFKDSPTFIQKSLSILTKRSRVWPVNFVLVKSRTGMQLDFAEDTVDLLWLDNSNSEDSLVFKEAYMGQQKFALCHC